MVLLRDVMIVNCRTFANCGSQDTKDLRTEEGGPALIDRITRLVNETIAADGSFGSVVLSAEEVLAAIDRGSSEGGPSGRHWVLDPIDGTKG